MSLESFNQTSKLPEEIIIPEEEFLLDEQGKRYSYEKNGTKYGGDYLSEPPQKIDLDIPPAPTEMNQVI